VRRRSHIIAFVLAAIPILAVGSLIGVYEHYNREFTTIDDVVRSRSPGRFAKTADGFVHYQLDGPAAARTVVLIPGFSVPYYIWDPTFQGLVNAGFRVLRYDLLGRGLSDRPELIYGPDLFDRQLANLLTAVGIVQPVDLAGLSMGGPIQSPSHADIRSESAPFLYSILDTRPASHCPRGPSG
jgi:alpha-beta hydrolase superfamily lysophospholipase